MSSLNELQSVLRKNGASQQQISSNIVRTISELIDEGKIDGLEDARSASKKLWWLVERAHEASIDSREARDGVNVYSEMLYQTREIVGDDMSEAIWIKAIESASYAAWRTIMGPKFKEEGYGRR